MPWAWHHAARAARVWTCAACAEEDARARCDTSRGRPAFGLRPSAGLRPKQGEKNNPHRELPLAICTSSRRLPSALALGQADDGTLLVRAAPRLKRVRLTPAGAMFAWRRVAPPLLLLLLLLVQGVAHGTSESHIISNEQPVPAADESGEGVDARNSVVGISMSGVEPEVRPQAFRLSIPLCAKS